MANFPLYTSLKIINKDTSKIDGKKFIKMFKKIDPKSHELIYALIRSFQMEKNIDVLNADLPFEGRQLKSGYRFDFDKLPLQLQQILFEFINRDLNK